MSRLWYLLRLTPRLAAFCILALAGGVLVALLCAPFAGSASAVTPPQAKWT